MIQTTAMEEGSGKVLIVDDSKIDRKLIARSLLAQGMEVFEASDGTQGLAFALQVHPDVIICDMIMPGMDGLEFSRRIRAEEQIRDHFLIIMTSLEAPTARLEALKAGCDEYLNKPLVPDELVLRIKAAIRYRRQQIELADKNARLRHVLAQVRRQQEDVAQDITIARRVQRCLLPDRPPRRPGYEFGYFLEPSDLIGGDYLDIIVWDDRHVGLVEADVSGHGIPAAIVTGMFHAWVHSELHSNTNLQVFFEQLNRYIYDHTLPEMYMTAFVGLLDLQTGDLDYVLAGHPEPLIYTGDRPLLFPSATTHALGLYPDIEVNRSQYRIRPGADFFVFSDGLWDCFSGNHAGHESQLPAMLSTFSKDKRDEGLGWFFYEAVRVWGDRPPADDVAILFLHREE